MAATTTTTTTSSSAVELLDQCVTHGIPDRALARRALHATLSTLGSRLTEDEADALASTLPSELACIVDQSEYSRDFDAAELYALVAQKTYTSLGDAREQTDVVLRVIGEAMDADVRRRLCRVLPEPIARRLEPSELVGAPPPHHTTHATPTAKLSTLAAGQPGSSHPLSESAPSAGQTHSVARSDNPHADTKLSSAREV